MSSPACLGRTEKHVDLEIRNTGCHVGMMVVWEFLPSSSPFLSALTPCGLSYASEATVGYWVKENLYLPLSLHTNLPLGQFLF